MTSTRFGLFVAIVLSVFASKRSSADVKISGIFSDHMVIQRDAKFPVWGTADAGEHVTVKAANREASTTADASGKWRVELEPISSTDPIEVTISASNTLTIKDVLVGEVWLCSGQSNMVFKLKSATGGSAAVAAAKRPTIRLFSMDRDMPDAPREFAKARWDVCSPQNVGDFSAVAYFFGLELQQKLDVPIGLIDSSWGGTRAEAWIPRFTFDALKLPYEPAWTQQWLSAKLKPGAKDERRKHTPAVLYNGMIAPIAGFAMRGAVWYQGETNTAHPKEYRQVLDSIVTSWREAWRQGDFPFLVVQLPNFESGNRDWVTMRAMQEKVTQDQPNAGIVVTIDVGTPKNIHPPDKLTVGKRLALLAEHLAYKLDVPYSGPTFKSMTVDGDKAVVAFDHTDGGGLMAKNEELKGFELAGDDGKFIASKGTVEGERVVLTADRVTSPKSVRYGWANNPECSLYNKAGLPAVPFDSSTPR
jgi:sialate O-acetylesterase